MRTKAWNPQAALESLSSAAFGAYLLYLTVSQRYLSYVTPRMKPYLYFSAVVLLLWAVLGLSRLFRPQHRLHLGRSLVLLIPLLLFLTPHTPLVASNVSAQNNLFQRGQSTAAGGNSAADADAAYSAAEKTAETTVPKALQAAMKKDVGRVLTGLDPAAKTITVSTDDFCGWVDELYMNPTDYTGYTIQITGYVYKSTQVMTQTEFAVARLAITCCTADLTPYGLICESSAFASLKADTWITVTGVAAPGQHNGETEPRLTVRSITPASAIPGYVYPF